MNARKELKTISYQKEIGLPQTASKFIDIELVGEPLRPTDATAVELNTKIFDFMMNNQNKVNTELLFDFQEEFTEWSKSFLREHGIYSGPLKGHIIPQLIALLTVENLPIWDKDELRMMTEVHQKSQVQKSLPHAFPT
ncbi:hypothetical protein GcM3_120022 [Golovinomyces cichoracearum]|uniref:Uncharacterized protein n=1 Tax=Golovinomyces cichoracearum TaxID=62708 RepID=A0A420I7B1_9PEZI|nr:hypothetical protein GcM3_120022 [Golovinomyces cichoracearum]